MKIDNHYIIEDLKNCCKELGSFVSGDRVVLSKINTAVKPEIYQLKEQMATIGYHIYSPEWKNEIFETWHRVISGSVSWQPYRLW